MTVRGCFNECGRDARPGYLTCDECERSAAIARSKPGTLPHAIAHVDDLRRALSHHQTCRSCEAPVVWAVTINRKSMPLDPDPTENGNVRLTGQSVTSDNGRIGPECEVLGIGTLFDDDQPRYMSHFASCPNAAGHRRR